MKKFVFLIYFLSLNIYASAALTTIASNISLYSEYYPNNNAAFKGTIIFENGSGTDLNEWKKNKQFFDCVRQLGSVFLYDRSGLGKSPIDPTISQQNPITGKSVSDKLLILLKKRNIKPPYIIIGHSYGAIYAGYFVLKNPDLIQGILLVDPVPRDFHFQKEKMKTYQPGIKEASNHSSVYIFHKYGKSDAESMYQIIGFENSKQSIKNLGHFNDRIPVIIVSSKEMESKKPLVEDWFTSQKQWLNNNPNSNIFEVSSSHFVQFEQPQIVCDQIKKLISSR